MLRELTRWESVVSYTAPGETHIKQSQIVAQGLVQTLRAGNRRDGGLHNKLLICLTHALGDVEKSVKLASNQASIPVGVLAREGRPCVFRHCSLIDCLQNSCPKETQDFSSDLTPSSGRCVRRVRLTNAPKDLVTLDLQSLGFASKALGLGKGNGCGRWISRGWAVPCKLSDSKEPATHHPEPQTKSRSIRNGHI